MAHEEERRASDERQGQDEDGESSSHDDGMSWRDLQRDTDLFQMFEAGLDAAREGGSYAAPHSIQPGPMQQGQPVPTLADFEGVLDPSLDQICRDQAQVAMLEAAYSLIVQNAACYDEVGRLAMHLGRLQQTSLHRAQDLDCLNAMAEALAELANQCPADTPDLNAVTDAVPADTPELNAALRLGGSEGGGQDRDDGAIIEET